MRFRQVAVGLLAVACLAASPTSALVFNFTTIAGDSLTADQAAAFQSAGNAWSRLLDDPITVNVQIGFTALDSGVLGSTSASFTGYTYSAVAAALAGDAKSADDAQAVASFATAFTGNYALTTAQARAIGLAAAPTADASIEFSTGYAFSTSRNADGTIAAGTYDLIGVAEHEIGHALGFISSADGGFGGAETLLDQFRYSAPGTRTVADASGAYFSLTNGATGTEGATGTDRAYFSPGPNDSYQASHWLQGTTSTEVDGLRRTGVNALMDPAISTDQVQNITLLDLRALDVIGYDRVSTVAAVPEPATWATFVLGFGLIGVARRRRGLAVIN